MIVREYRKALLSWQMLWHYVIRMDWNQARWDQACAEYEQLSRRR